jgi:hypothetical protein
MKRAFSFKQDPGRSRASISRSISLLAVLVTLALSAALLTTLRFGNVAAISVVPREPKYVETIQLRHGAAQQT